MAEEEELVDVMARGMIADSTLGGVVDDTALMRSALSAARAALASAREAGWTLAPAEASTAMIDAALAGDCMWSTNAIPRIKAAYRAMIAAA